ncbi:MAG: cation:H+ antiporter [Bacteroidia bacterium]|jgi:cation:H+ antiporter
MVVWMMVFSVSLAVLILAAKYFTEAAERIGLALKMTPFMVGVIIVAVGTSLPELIAGIIAASQGSSEIVVGNVIGANISNIFLILGVTTLVSKKSIHLGEEYIFIDLHFMLGSITFLVIFLMDGVVTWKEGIILIIGFIVYQMYLLRSEKPDAMPSLNSPEKILATTHVSGKDLGILLAAGLGIYFGANYTIEAVTELASGLGISKALVGLTVLSLGTTLPELAVSITAARAGHPQIAVGNILGSCIFNAFMVTGTASFISPLVLPEEIHFTALSFLISAAVFFYLLSQDKKVSKWEGMLFILFYLVFVLKLGKII